MQHHFRHHTAVGRVFSLLALSLADAAILQFDLHRSARSLQNELNEFLPDLRTISNETAGEIYFFIKKELTIFHIHDGWNISIIRMISYYYYTFVFQFPVSDTLWSESNDLILAANAMHHFIMNQADFSSAIQRRILNERLMHCEKLIAYVFTSLLNVR